MIPLSLAAEADLDELARYYARHGRDAAIDRLVVNVRAACGRYEQRRGSFYDAPRPYPGLADLGLRWTKEGSYWFAFKVTDFEPVVAGIFHDTADIPSRVPR